MASHMADTNAEGARRSKLGRLHNITIIDERPTTDMCTAAVGLVYGASAIRQQTVSVCLSVHYKMP